MQTEEQTNVQDRSNCSAGSSAAGGQLSLGRPLVLLWRTIIVLLGWLLVVALVGAVAVFQFLKFVVVIQL